MRLHPRRGPWGGGSSGEGKGRSRRAEGGGLGADGWPLYGFFKPTFSRDNPRGCLCANGRAFARMGGGRIQEEKISLFFFSLPGNTALRPRHRLWSARPSDWPCVQMRYQREVPFPLGAPQGHAAATRSSLRGVREAGEGPRSLPLSPVSEAWPARPGQAGPRAHETPLQDSSSVRR